MTAVVDTSVILAVMSGEADSDLLERPGQLLHLSTVNLAEVHTKIAERGGNVDDVDHFLRPLPLRIRKFDEVQARITGRLRPLTRHLGLSLGDRACLALASLIRLPVLSADRKWAELDPALGIDVRLIR